MHNKILKNYINYIIKENLESTNQNLYVFDFDMTLYNSDKETWNEEILNSLYKAIEDSNTRVILCTARTSNNEIISNTESILNTKEISLFNDNQYQYSFDNYYFKSELRKEGVPKYKAFTISDEASMFNVNIVKFWDDREDTLLETEKVLSDLNVEYEGIKPELF